METKNNEITVNGDRGDGEGNTKLPRVNQLKSWCFTFNNYNFDDILILETLFKSICVKYVFQEETGTNGTKHLQGVICLKKAMRWTEFNLNKSIHWEKTKSVNDAINYCQKDDTRTGKIYSMGLPPKLKVIDKLRNWQQSICNLINDEPNDRTINWVYDKDGNCGKTVFSKYLYSKYKCIIATGGAYNDVACILAECVKNGFDLNDKFTFIMNVPRSVDKISYKAIEAVKDGLITSPKFNSQTLVFNCPHVWIFSNEMPEISRLSKDRWMIYNIIDDKLVLSAL